MNSDAEDVRREGEGGRPKFWTCGMIALFVLLGFVVVFFFAWIGLNASARREFEEELAKVRARGEPATPAELAPPEIPDDENAAVVLRDAFAEYDAAYTKTEADPVAKEWDIVGFEPFEPERAKIEKAVELLGEALRLTREALERPKCRHDLDWAAGFGIRLHHLAPTRGMARALRAEALLHANSGRPEKAARSVIDIFRLARTMDGERTFITKLVQIAIIGIGADALAKAERAAPLPDGLRREIIKELGRIDFDAMARDAMIGERAQVPALLEAVMKDGGAGLYGGPPALMRFVTQAFPFHFMRDGARMIRTETEMIDAIALPPWEALPRIQTLEARVEALPVWRAPLTGMFMPALATPYSRHVGARAQVDTARVGLALELYRSARGEYPDKLEDLAPEFILEIPKDPFTGKALIYRRKGKGFVVYSLGENMKDDGGVFKQYHDGDVIWTDRGTKPAGEEEEEEEGEEEGEDEEHGNDGSHHGGTEDTENGEKSPPR